MITQHWRNNCNINWKNAKIGGNNFELLQKFIVLVIEFLCILSVHHRALGDVAGTNRFENLAIDVQKDLDIIKLCHRKGSKVPKLHFEKKTFNIVRCNTHLAETEMEIEVVRGISYHVSKPKDVDTYVKIEFPYPPVCITFNIISNYLLLLFKY